MKGLQPREPGRRKLGGYENDMNVALLPLVTAFTGSPEYASLPPITDVEVVESADSTHVLAFDPDGEVAAEVVVWAVEGEIRLDALFPDGLYLSVVTDGESVTIESDDAAEVAERMGALLDHLGQTEQEGEEWGDCAGHAAHAAVGCALARPFMCVVGSVIAACECLPLLVDEFEGYSCPGLG